MSDDIHADLLGLAGGDFNVVLADPAWTFKGNSAAKPGRNAARHYPVMTLAEIEALPVRDVVAKEAALFLWITTPLLVIGAHIPIMKAWGFTPTATAFTWVKLRRGHPWHHKIGAEDLHLGQGLTTRKNTEVIVLGKRGRSLRVDAGVQEVILAPVREHSRKPDESYRRINRYVGEGRRKLELFSREDRFGFHGLGNQAGMFNVAAE